MRIESTRLTEHLGSVKVYGVRRILELDSGARAATRLDENLETHTIGRDAIDDVERRTAIVLPIKNEDLKVFEGVLTGIPHNCLMIVISNSQRGEIDAFKSEKDILSRFCHATRRQALIVHQKDPLLAQALEQADYAELLDEEGLVRNGKSEGMIIGILLARLHERDYVGFIDTDNYIPGAVWEYAKHYAIGFSLAKSPLAMVRILWRYKPKLAGELYFKKWGRVSEITNRYINHFISIRGKFESEIIKTANAGEHAMSLDLAERLTYASGYGVETQELVSIFEQFGGILPIADKTIAKKGVEVIQTETLNPHLHEERGGEHLLQEMLLPSLSVIYHSPLCEQSTKEIIIKQLLDQKCLKPDEEVPRMRLIPPPQKANMDKFAQSFETRLPLYSVPKGEMLPGKLISAEANQVGTETKKVVFTDLDGTLLHPLTSSYSQALDSIRLLQEKDIPIIFCSAKTRGEQQAYMEELDIKDPFIVENGGAIFIPKNYFRFPFAYDKATRDYLVIELGAPYQEIRQRLKKADEETDGHIVGFGDMDVEEVARETALNLKSAELARQREYSEMVRIEGDRKIVELVLKEIKKAGLNYTPAGKLYEVIEGNDKGKAVQILTALYKLNFAEAWTAGIGNDEDDSPMLSAVDLPILVQGHDNRWKKSKVKNIYRARGVGPEGWDTAVKELVVK
jgi:mannosyl-3-phosphoglycerate synthase